MLRKMHASNAHHHQQQRQRQAAPGQLAPGEIGAHGNDHRQRANDHRGQRHTRELNGRGQRQVIQQVAHGGELEGF